MAGLASDVSVDLLNRVEEAFPLLAARPAVGPAANFLMGVCAALKKVSILK